MQPYFIKCPHVGRIAVIENFEIVMHHYPLTQGCGMDPGDVPCQITFARAKA